MSSTETILTRTTDSALPAVFSPIVVPDADEVRVLGLFADGQGNREVFRGAASEPAASTLSFTRNNDGLFVPLQAERCGSEICFVDCIIENLDTSATGLCQLVSEAGVSLAESQPSPPGAAGCIGSPTEDGLLTCQGHLSAVGAPPVEFEGCAFSEDAFSSARRVVEPDGEVLFATGYGVYRETGEPTWCSEDGHGFVYGAQLDLDPDLEFISSTSDQVRAYDDRGQAIWGWPVPAGTVTPVMLSLADLDGDQMSEVVFTMGRQTILLEENGLEKWRFTADGSAALASAPLLMDIANDGRPEIVVMGMGQVYVIDAWSGLGMLQFGSGALNSEGSVGAADLDGDCNDELVLPADNQFLAVWFDSVGGLSCERTAWWGLGSSPDNQSRWNSTEFTSLEASGAYDLKVSDVELCTLEDGTTQVWVEVQQLYEQGAEPPEVELSVSDANSGIELERITFSIDGSSSVVGILLPTSGERVDVSVDAGAEDCDPANNTVTITLDEAR